MTRFLRIATAFVVCSIAACTASDESVSITMFQAAPDSIEAGQTSQLMITVNPPEAQIMIHEVGDMTGRPMVPVSPTVTTTYHLTATLGSAQAEGAVTISVGTQNVVAIGVDIASETTTAGETTAVALTAIGTNGLPTPSFRGTIHLASSDPAAALPPDLTFTAADKGVKIVKVAFKTAGLNSVTASDVSGGARRGTAVVTVKPAAASTCVASQAPTSAIAGTLVGMVVAIRDPFGNAATGYTGTVRLTATDARASLPGDTTFGPGDAGSRAFSATLVTTGVQTLSAVDLANPAVRCDVPIAIMPAAPKLVVTAPPNVNAGYPVNISVAVKDMFDNPIPGYAGTVQFASTDTRPGAVTPAPITFSGGEAGTVMTTATFMTLGPQMITARDSSSPAATGSAIADVHGLVYTAPATGRVRLVANAAQSTAQVVQLDLVANERLEISSFFGGGPGSFAAGMNLPLDTTRVTGDTTLLTAGNALVAAGVPPVAAARIGDSDHVLYTAVSRKRVAGTVFTQSTEVQAGQVFYSVRLKLQASSTVGPVFDGAQASPLFLAAVRDQYGDNFVSQNDFGVGKLEVQ
ncbi:MAG TPA: hypothetical protein VFT22_12065 [Kofleriaceae bacterium]|nr:hypothetical protein [Kofleriaceae bacterium]